MLYNSTVQVVSRGRGDFYTKVGSLGARFVDMGALDKTQVGNGLSKFLYLQGQTINDYDKSVFTLKDSGLDDEEGKKTNVSDPLTVGQRRSGSFLSFMMEVHPYQVDTNCKHSRINCRACIQITLDVDGIDTSIDTQTLKTTHDLLFHLADLYNEINLDIGTLKKDRDDIFSECCAKIFKAKYLLYFNEVLFLMVKNILKVYVFGKNNSHSTEKWVLYMTENVLW